MKFPLSQVKRFASRLDHSEGIAVAQDGTVFAGGEAGQVYRISPDGQTVAELAKTGGFSLGITLDRHNNIFVCDSSLRSVIRVNESGHISVFADSTASGKFQTPNFTVFDSDGNLYLSE
jgi:gluconolactonase